MPTSHLESMTPQQRGPLLADHFRRIYNGARIEVRGLHPETHRVATFVGEEPVKLAVAAMKMQNSGFNVYSTLNPTLRPLSPKPRLAQKGELTSDADILRRHLLLIDIDRAGSTKGPATAEERAATCEASLKAIALLTASHGWPIPAVRINSGNGVHLQYLLSPDSPMDDAAYRDILAYVASKVNNEIIKVDRVVYNAGRITRLPFCLNIKAGLYADVLEYAPTAAPVPTGKLIEVAKLAPEPSPRAYMIGSSRTPASTDSTRPLLITEADVLGIIEEYPDHFHLSRVEHRRRDDVWFHLSQCPFALEMDGDEHDPPKPVALRLTGQHLGFHCMSPRCGGKKWQDLKALLEEETGEPFTHRIYGEEKNPAAGLEEVEWAYPEFIVETE